MNIIPINGRILLKKFEKISKTISGIILPEVIKETSNQGIIINLNNKINNLLKSEIKIGDHVIFNKYSGQEIKINEEELILIKEEDILAIIN